MMLLEIKKNGQLRNLGEKKILKRFEQITTAEIFDFMVEKLWEKGGKENAGILQRVQQVRIQGVDDLFSIQTTGANLQLDLKDQGHLSERLRL